jgi:sodium/potassium-transporting ATPase subunit alpha
LIERCTQIVTDTGNVRVLDDSIRSQVRSLKDQWSAEGKRVILLARKVLSRQDILLDPSSREFESEMMDQARTDLILVGMVGIVDPPRDEIPEVVKTLRGAGIRIFMVRCPYPRCEISLNLTR